MITLDIDSSAVVVYTNKLEKLHRSGLPVAIRTALNSAAFDVKQNTMPRSATRFINRTTNFFRANSSVQMASGFDVKNMQSVVGFVSDRLRLGANNYAVKDLENQEYDSDIGGKTFIPMDTARSGDDNSQRVLPKNRLSTILKSNRIVSSNFSRITGKSKNQSDKAKFKAAVYAAGRGGYVFGNQMKKILFRVESLSKDSYKLRALYSVKAGRKAKLKGKGEGFMRIASLQSANKLEEHYIKAAKAQIERLMR